MHLKFERIDFECWMWLGCVPALIYKSQILHWHVWGIDSLGKTNRSLLSTQASIWKNEDNKDWIFNYVTIIVLELYYELNLPNSYVVDGLFPNFMYKVVTIWLCKCKKKT